LQSQQIFRQNLTYFQINITREPTRVYRWLTPHFINIGMYFLVKNSSRHFEPIFADVSKRERGD